MKSGGEAGGTVSREVLRSLEKVMSQLDPGRVGTGREPRGSRQRSKVSIGWEGQWVAGLVRWSN